MVIAFMGGNQAGMIGLLTIKALGHKISYVISSDNNLLSLAKELGLTTFRSVREINSWGSTDLLLSVHGREKVPASVLDQLPYGGINLHPCLFAFKGRSPVERLVETNIDTASVGAHVMTENYDEGEVLYEPRIDTRGDRDPISIYNMLYWLYPKVIIRVLGDIKHEC